MVVTPVSHLSKGEENWPLSLSGSFVSMSFFPVDGARISIDLGLIPGSTTDVQCDIRQAT